MLSQENLALAALLASIAGTTVLFAFSALFEPLPLKIAEIDQSLDGWPVEVNAKVVSLHEKDGTVFLQLYDGTGKIKAVLFNPREGQRALLKKNGFASFEGKAQLYKGEMEIVVEVVSEWQ